MCPPVLFPCYSIWFAVHVHGRLFHFGYKKKPIRSMKGFGTWGENDRKKTKKEKKREKGQIWKWRTRAFSYLILFRFSRENKGKREEKSGELPFVLPSLCLKREERLRCRGFESSHFFCVFFICIPWILHY